MKLRNAVALGAMATAYWFPVRRWMARSGTTRDERARVMSGDAVIAKPTHSAMDAITIDAPPEDIWPWLVQIGYRRGGLYSYDWLDRLFGFLDRPSETRIIPQFQRLAVGDRIPLGPRWALTVTTIEPPRALVLSFTKPGFEWVWQFGLYAIDPTHTRLVSRGIERVAPSVSTWFFMRVMEPASFIMTRRMLRNLKARAEVLYAARASGTGRSRSVA